MTMKEFIIEVYCGIGERLKRFSGRSLLGGLVFANLFAEQAVFLLKK